MSRGLFFLILCLGAVWLILDDIYGRKRVSNLVKNIVGQEDYTPKVYKSDWSSKGGRANG